VCVSVQVCIDNDIYIDVLPKKNSLTDVSENQKQKQNQKQTDMQAPGFGL